MSKQFKTPMWMVTDGNTPHHALGVVREEGRGDVPYGTYFVALFYRRKAAAELAKKWGHGAKVIKVSVQTQGGVK